MSRLFFKIFHKSGGNFEKQKKESLNVGVRDSEKLLKDKEENLDEYPVKWGTVSIGTR